MIGPSSDVPENIDYDFAQQELMVQQMGDDPIQEAISNIEKQHEEDKQGWLLSHFEHLTLTYPMCRFSITVRASVIALLHLQ